MSLDFFDTVVPRRPDHRQSGPGAGGRPAPGRSPGRPAGRDRHRPTTRHAGDNRLDTIAALLRHDALRARNLPALARQHGLSHSALRQGLSLHTGSSPMRLLREARLRLVAEAFGRGLPVAAAARCGGFADPFPSARLFRNVSGCAPSAWRRSHDT